ncbi:MAG: carbohydrate binding domain-containing protein, partial [Woeseia sp.]|nr:carbohydrate binding domain-containing protein [Woeseia sp.]
GEADSRVLFDMGQAVGEVYIDDVSLVVTGSGGGGGTGGGPFDDGLLTNGDFEAGTDPWLLGVSNPIGAENVIDDGGNNVFFVNVEAAGNSFDVNLSQKLAITPGASYTLTFKARSNVSRPIKAGIGQSGGSFFSATEDRNLTTAWQTFEIELTATDDNGGGDFGEADSRVLFDMGQAVGEVYIDDVSLVVAGAGGGGAGGGGGDGGFVNGDFETGDFTGWTPERVPADRGSVAVDNSGQGGRAGTVARLITDADVSSPNDILLSQVALGAGTIATGDEINVSFDLYGSLSGAGGVVFVEVIFLNSAGEDEGGRNFVGPAAPYTPTTTWTTHSGTVIAGTGAATDGWDVSGGVTLQLKAACGAIDGCGVDASFDNVTFTISTP